MIRHEDVYQIGTIVKTHALKGEVVLNFTDDIFDTSDTDYLIVEVDGILVPFFIEEYRFRNGSSALMKFDSIHSADQAQPIIGCDVYIEKTKVAERGEEDITLNYFVGFAVQTPSGEIVGRITDVDDNTENWLFVVETEQGSEVLIPAHEEFINSIDHDAHILTMDLPVGLLDL